MNAILAIAFKDIKLLIRDRSSLIWVVAFPIVMAVLFGSMYGGMESGGSSRIAVALVDQDGSARADSMAKALEATQAVSLKRMSLEQARQKVLKGDLAAYIVLRPGLEKASLMSPSDAPLIQLGADPKRQMESGMIEGLISQAWFQELGKGMPLAAEIMKQGTGVERVSVQPKGINPSSPFEVSFPQAMLWALVAVCATFATTMVKERTEGTLQRLWIAPISRSQLLAGKGLACFLTSLGVTVGLIVFGSLVFGVRALDHPAQFLIASVSISLCYSGLMMLVSVMGRTERAVGGASWGLMMLFNMFGGGMMPLMAMSGWMQTASDFSPAKWATLSLEGAIWRGFSVQEMVLPCGILLAVGVFGLLVGSRLAARA